MAKLGLIFIGFIIAIYGHLNDANAVKVNVTWIVGKKVNKYGDDLVLVCLSNGHEIGDKTMRWYKNENDLISFNGSPNNATKYRAKVGDDRVWLTIRNLEKSDVNITYYCSFSFYHSQKRLLLEEDVLNNGAVLSDERSQKEQNKLPLIMGLLFSSIVVVVCVVLLTVMVWRRRQRRQRQQQQGNLRSGLGTSTITSSSGSYRTCPQPPSQRSSSSRANVEMELTVLPLLENGHPNGTIPNGGDNPGEHEETELLLNGHHNGIIHNGDINHTEERNGMHVSPNVSRGPIVHNGVVPVQYIDSNNSSDRRSDPNPSDPNIDSEPTTVHSDSYRDEDEPLPGPSDTSDSFSTSIQQSQDLDLSYKGFVESHYSGMSSDSAVAISGLANNLHVTSVDEQTDEKSFDDTDNNDSINRDNEQARAIATEGERIRKQKRKFQFTLPDEIPDDSQQVDNIDSQHNEGSSGSQRRNYIRREYSNQTLREKSYDSNPWSEHPTPKELAKAGFFYLGSSKSTECYSCGKKINWEENQSQDPMNPIFHKENCQHLKNLKP